MLIIEGCDGTGKTTLAQKLTKALSDLGHIYCHFTRLPDNFDRYWGYVERMSSRVVQDRFHLSEIVYSKTRGDKTQLCSETYRLIDAKLRLLGSFTVLITADSKLIESRWEASRQSQMYGLEKTLKAAELYNEIGTPYGPFKNYDIDVDYKFHCMEDYPYVSDVTIVEILELYRKRFSTLHSIANRRPTSLEVGGVRPVHFEPS